MIEPATPANEAERQIAVERYRILDTLPEGSYDDLTALMALVCDVPISLVGLIEKDRHWLKSHHGIDLSESPRRLSFCGHAIVAQEALFCVEDARLDPRFHDNPLVAEHGAVGYAGAALIDADGFALGTLCVFSNEPLRLLPEQKNALISTARQVMYLLERHLREQQLEQTTDELRARNDELKQFAGAVSHDLKAPAVNMTFLAEMIEEDAAELMSTEVLECLLHIKESSRAMQMYVDSLFVHYTSTALAECMPEPVELSDLYTALRCLTPRNDTIELAFSGPRQTIVAHRAALQQVLLNLVANAVKHASKPVTHIGIAFEQNATGYRFSVTDDGPGIPAEFHESIFERFGTGSTAIAEGNPPSGTGLATVRRLLDQIGGSIEVDSQPGDGSCFTVTLPNLQSEQEQPLKLAA